MRAENIYLEKSPQNVEDHANGQDNQEHPSYIVLCNFCVIKGKPIQ